MPNNFGIKLTIYFFWGLIAFIGVLWKPAIWPALKRLGASIRQRYNCHVAHCESEHAKVIRPEKPE